MATSRLLQTRVSAAALGIMQGPVRTTFCLMTGNDIWTLPIANGRSKVGSLFEILKFRRRISPTLRTVTVRVNGCNDKDKVS
jgi:hypothetical protein